MIAIVVLLIIGFALAAIFYRRWKKLSNVLVQLLQQNRISQEEFEAYTSSGWQPNRYNTQGGLNNTQGPPRLLYTTPPYTVSPPTNQPHAALPNTTQPYTALPYRALPYTAGTHGGTPLTPDAAGPVNGSVPPVAFAPLAQGAAVQPNMPQPANMQDPPARTPPFVNPAYGVTGQTAVPAAGSYGQQGFAAQPSVAPLAYKAPLYNSYAPLQTEGNKRERGISVLLFVGVAFVLLAGFIFATNNWDAFGNETRLTLLICQMLLFFVAAGLCSHKLKIKNTGMAFYTLGCVFIWVTTIATVYLDLLGQGLHNFYIVNSIGLLLVCLAAIGGTFVYRHVIFVALSGITGELALLLVLHEVLPSLWNYTVTMGAATLMMMLGIVFSSRVAAVNAGSSLEKQPPTVWDMWAKFWYCNFWVVGFIFAVLLLFVAGNTHNLPLTVLVALGIVGYVFLLCLPVPKISNIGLPCLLILFYISLVGQLAFLAGMQFASLALLCLVSFWVMRLLPVFLRQRLHSKEGDIILLVAAAGSALPTLYKISPAVQQDVIIVLLIGLTLAALTFGPKSRHNQSGKYAAYALPLVVPIISSLVRWQFVSNQQNLLYTKIWHGSILLSLLIALAVLWLAQKYIVAKRLEVPCTIAFLLLIPALFCCYLLSSYRILLIGVELIFIHYTVAFIILCIAEIVCLRRGKGGRVAGLDHGKVVLIAGVTAGLALTCQIANYLLKRLVNPYWLSTWDNLEALLLLWAFVAGAILLLVIGAILRSRAKHPVGDLSRTYWNYASTAGQCINLCLGIWFFFRLNKNWVIVHNFTLALCAVVILLVATHVLILVRKQSTRAFALPLLFYGLLKAGIPVPTQRHWYILIGIAALLLMLLGCVAHTQLLWRNENGRQINWPSVIGGFGVVWLMVSVNLFATIWDNAGYVVYGLLLLVVWLLLQTGRIGKKANANNILHTAALGVFLLAWWLQPWLVFPKQINTEIHLLILIAAALVLRFVIWRAYSEQLHWLVFGVTLLAVIVQGVESLYLGGILDAIVLGLACFGLVILGCVLKRRSWFYLGAGGLLLLGWYHSRVFWLQIAWWVYLMVVGIALIALAALNESYRGKGNSLKNRILSLRFFTEWRA